MWKSSAVSEGFSPKSPKSFTPVIYCSLWLIFVFSHKVQEKQERYLPSILQLQLFSPTPTARRIRRIRSLGPSLHRRLLTLHSPTPTLNSNS